MDRWMAGDLADRCASLFVIKVATFCWIALSLGQWNSFANVGEVSGKLALFYLRFVRLDKHNNPVA